MASSPARVPLRTSRSRVASALIAGMVAACAGDAVESPPESPPSGLAYSVNPAAYTVGVAIGPNTPSSSGGAVDAYDVAPALPAGLSLDPSTGVISGTPAAVSVASTYTVTATNSAGGTTASLGITVDRLNAMAVTPPDLTISLGRSQRYVATADYELAGARDVSPLATWSSSDRSVATVDAGGLALSVAEGSTTIHASLDAASGATALTVGPVSLVSVGIQEGLVLDIPADGRTMQLHLIATYSDDSTADVTELAIWSSQMGWVAVSDAAGTKGLVSTVELGDDVVEAAFQGAKAHVFITVY